MTIKYNDIPRTIKSTEVESRWWVTAAGEGVGELAFNGDRASVWKDEEVLVMDSGDGYITT